MSTERDWPDGLSPVPLLSTERDWPDGAGSAYRLGIRPIHSYNETVEMRIR